MVNKHGIKYSIAMAVKEIQIKAAMSSYFLLFRMPVTKKEKEK